ncbi:MAG: DUF1579 domain-containing protein [Planctomycetes bacterium]|nr:DUF1579 domain-containing protein [Planctomycetota bacterium]
MKTLSTFLTFAILAPLAAQEMPQPTKQHKMLAEQVGIWDAKMDMIDFTTGQPAQSKGTSVRKMPLGEFWLLDHFEADMMGMPFKGMGVTGYDPEKKKMVGTWIDSMTPSLMVIEGNWDKAGKVLTMSGQGVGMDGKPAKTTLITTVHGKDKHVFEMFTEMPDGKDVKLMTITYTRKARKMDKVGK